ncbi:S8 family serine peptidase [Shewanella cyperi]|uniref:S8 family serine peptidase n=1 Tax=Shewanella cyperi TaxID=2814292 RepID=UPI001A941B1C|nr:S8 family serine peptidase [Shewanella cyperi]QSX41258.1 S8 family serine peptidase [Shewanella cyperi]
MKLKSLTVATLAALYGAGMASAMPTSSTNVSATGSKGGVVLQAITKEELSRPKRVSDKAPQTNNAIRPMPGGLNQQHQPASAKAKFVEEPNRSGEDVYIVRLRDLPLATYDGRVKGYAATAQQVIRNEMASQTPVMQQGKQRMQKAAAVDQAQVQAVQQSRVESYRQYLSAKQNDVLQQARSQGIQNPVRANYTNAVNGFSIKMTQAQAKALAALPQVQFIERSTMQQIQTDRGPTFIGADQVWTGNTVTGLPWKGEGIVMGIIDTGINSDHVAFADIGGDGYDHTNPLGDGNYLGDCATGKLVCNDKLIGIYSWPVITDTYQGLAPATGEDIQGHGSHTAGTAAGNYVENVPLLAPSLGDGDGEPLGFTFESTSGVAPHANIIAYQVCLPEDGCPTEAILKAYEQAIADDVDVINFSIGGGEQFPWESATELAILSAREAGISVAVAAGNSGGDAHNTFFGSLGHSAPWEMVVAASTHDRVLHKTNNLISFSGGNSTPYLYIDPNSSWGDDIAGYSVDSISLGIPVSAADYGDPQCLNAFAPGTFSADQVVVCERGTNARVAKAHNVKAGGAGGFILYNQAWYSGITQEEQRLYDDAYPLPGIHVSNYTGNNILNWMNDGAAEHFINITGGSVDRSLDPAKGDMLADFSSLGPSMTYKHHMAPNIAAPGVDILAPYADEHPMAPGSAQSQDWAIISGTSMASPHVAGVMALVRQAHPDWTAAEVQSAMEMTASQTVRRDVDQYNPDGFPATQHRTGSGRVDAQAAVNAGLIMNETVENFRLANPSMGGDVRQLNLPQLANSNCRGGVCSWVRTVTATRDGSWTLSADQWVYDRWVSTYDGEIDMHNAKMEFFPASFSLKAGESQSIVIKADITDIQYQHDSKLLGAGRSLDGVELWTSVNLTASDSSIPKSHWPVSINFDHGGLPEAVNVEVHRDNGSYRIADLPLGASNDLVYRGHGPVKADIMEVTLPQDNNHRPIYSDGDYAPGHNQVTLFNVPEDTARFVVEVLEHTKDPGFNKYMRELGGSLAIHIGRDSNGNGEADFDEEWICSSTTQIELNRCSLTNPDAGQYWVLLSNTSKNMSDWDLDQGPDPWGYYGITREQLVDSYRVAMALVPSDASGLTIEGPATSDGSLVDLDLNWNLDNLAEGDVAYAGVDIGSSAAPGSIGFIPVRLKRGMDDVTVNNNQRVRGGDIVDVTVHVVENNTGTDRDFDLSTVIPAGLTLVPGSVKVSSLEQEANLSVDGNTVRVAGVQQDSGNWDRSYKVTTNETDALCRVPAYGRNDSGFVGLAKNYGFMPAIGGTMVDASGSWDYDATVGEWVYTNPFEIHMADYWGADGHMNLFHNEDYMSYDRFIVSPQGFVTFGPEWGAASHFISQKFPYYMNPYGPFVAPFWRGYADPANIGFSIPVDVLGAPLEQNLFEPWKGSGIALAYAGDDFIIEWVNARTQGVEASWFGTYPTGVEQNDRYTFDLIMNKGYRYGAGEFEFVMAYGDMDFADQGDYGSIGVHGNYGPLDVFGYPYGQEMGVSAAYNDLKEVTTANKVICLDYTGPEATQFDLSFQVRVAETAAGQTLTMDVVSDVSGMGQKVIANAIQVAGNITLAPFNAMTIAENTSADVTVAYADVDANPNLISVSGEHISALVHGNSAGSTVTITPDANWHGETQVSVTVADSVNPTDATTQSFMLTVTSDGIEPGCTDSAATNYDANANQDDGSCTFPAPPAAEPAKDTSSGGALGWLALLLAPVAMVRRRRLH